jgi:hypothetical protein
MPAYLMNADIAAVQDREAIKRAVVDVLRELGMLPKAANPKRSHLRVVENEPKPD